MVRIGKRSFNRGNYQDDVLGKDHLTNFGLGLGWVSCRLCTPDLEIAKHVAIAHRDTSHRL